MKKGTTLKRILGYSGKHIKYIISAMIFAIIYVSLTLLAPVLVGQAIDKIVGENDVDFRGIANIILVLLFVIVGAGLFQWLMLMCTNMVSYLTVRDMRRDTFKKLNSVPLSYIDTTPHGDIINRVINDVDYVGDGLLQGITQLFSGIVTIVGTIIFMLALNVKITIVVVIITPLSVLVASLITRATNKMYREQSVTQGELSGFTEEFISNQKLVKSFAHENIAEKQFDEINARLKVCGQKAQFYSSLSNPSTRLVNGFVYTGVGIIGSISVINGNLSVGQVSCFLTYANQYTKPFNEVTGVIPQFQTALASAGRIFSIIDELDEKPDNPDAVNIQSCKGNIEIENISFSYAPEKELIKNFSLSVKSGQRIAIVGPTGCGKTTFINLLMRFYDVNSGEIKIDGININDMTRDSLRNLYGMVLQESWLYSGTIRENITYGKPDATDEEVIRAAKSAYIHNFISRLPDGYDTFISEQGGNLSQGQKQLLCIARVMLCNPPMLILDEATSSIDTRTEIRVQKAFDKIMQGKTSFIVAHRLSTIKEADMILVMKDGNILEQGNHNELLAKKGFYYNLYNSQFAGNN